MQRKKCFVVQWQLDCELEPIIICNSSTNPLHGKGYIALRPFDTFQKWKL